MTTGRHGAREPGALLFVALLAITFVGPLSIHMFLPALPFVRQAFAVAQTSARTGWISGNCTITTSSSSI